MPVAGGGFDICAEFEKDFDYLELVALDCEVE